MGQEPRLLSPMAVFHQTIRLRWRVTLRHLVAGFVFDLQDG